MNNIFLKRIYQNSSTSIGYCPQFFALSRQPSTFEHILVYVVLLECAAHSTHDLKGHYSTVELQKHMALTVGFEPTQPCGPVGFQDQSLKPLEYVSNIVLPTRIELVIILLVQVYKFKFVILLPTRSKCGVLYFLNRNNIVFLLSSGNILHNFVL